MLTESTRQEQRIAQKLGSIFGGRGQPQPGSGNQALAPNDVAVVNEVHIECKTTSFKTLVVQYDWIAKTTKRALMFGVNAVVAINFSSFGTTDYFIIRDNEYYNLLRVNEEYNKLRDGQNDLMTECTSLRNQLNNYKRHHASGRVGDAYEGQLP